MRIALLTGNDLRHKYIAHQIAKVLDLALVVTEEKSPEITAVHSLPPKDAELLRLHFEGRAKSEQDFFGEYFDFPSKTDCIYTEHGKLHSDKVLLAFKRKKVDAVALFGSSIIKAPILDMFPEKIINLHLGLSPYYRGSGTNFFPLLYGEPECLGATFHLATPVVDTGGILHQYRPEEFTEEDSIHTIGNTIISEAGKLYPKVLSGYLSGRLLPGQVVVKTSGKVFRIRDFTPEHLLNVQQNLRLQLREYLNNKEERIDKTPIVEGFK